MESLDDLSINIDFPPLGLAPAIVAEAPPLGVYKDTPSLQLFSKTERDVIELSLESLTVDVIALRLALPKSAVLQILSKPDIQDHLKMLSESMNQMETMRLKGLCERMIDEKVSEAEENNTALTKRDILEVIKVYNDILSAERKAKAPKEQENVYINILNQVIGK